MKKINGLFAFILLLNLTAKAQSNYTFAASSGTYTAITGTNPTVSLAYPPSKATDDDVTTTDEGRANGIPIGFSFKFHKKTYTQLNANTNGWVNFGNAIDTTNGYYSNSLTSGPLFSQGNAVLTQPNMRPLIAPLWDDLDLVSASNLTYTTSGSAPNRVFTIQWSNVKWSWSATAAVVSFQVKLYETTNVIQFVYRSETGAANSATASIGITGEATGSNNFMSISGLTTSATVSQTAETNNIATKPANGLTFTFTPIPLEQKDAAFVPNSLVIPPAVSCYSTPQTYSVILRNNGSDAIAPGAATVTLVTGGVNGQTINVANTRNLATDSTETITFSTVNLNNPGATSATFSIALAGGLPSSNDTIKTTFNTAKTISTFPALENFQTLDVFTWIKSLVSGEQAWGVSTSYINSALSDSIRAYAGTNFVRFSPISQQIAYTNAILYTHCLSIPSGRTNYNMTFWMTHDSSRAAGRDSLYVVVSENKGITWTRLGNGFARLRTGFNRPAYAQETVNLAAYAGKTIQVGFEGVGYYGNVIGLDEITINAQGTPLPIFLNTFSGYKIGSVNKLEWSTGNELNNAGFELQRSVDGNKFAAINYTKSKAENGNSSNILNYTFTDVAPLAGTNYYRLKQIDKDGAFTHSRVVAIKGNNTKLDITSVYPNPTKGNLQVVIGSPSIQKIIVSITDLAGKAVKQQIVEAVIGDNQVTVNTNILASGTYLLKTVANNGEVLTQKFVKQ